MRKLRLFIAVSCVAASSFVLGCASHRTVRTESTTYPESAPAPVVVERQTTTTTTTDAGSNGGVLSSTVNVVGEVIALPFRAVGAVVSAIF
jgi:hypothetical protein